ncbi:hypothetical protein SAMN04515695_1008 [Pseudovibrio sp. Tun.PSC04-5.I4]|nr:hypothetical protein SAMN04515695_1008 [Pseudovibrio sp. Tun.PSC04-5.I4]
MNGPDQYEILNLPSDEEMDRILVQMREKGRGTSAQRQTTPDPRAYSAYQARRYCQVVWDELQKPCESIFQAVISTV